MARRGDDKRTKPGNPSHRPLRRGGEHLAGGGRTETVGRPVADGPLHRYQFGSREQRQMLGNTLVVAADQSDRDAALAGVGPVERRLAHRRPVDLDPPKGGGIGGMGQATELPRPGVIAGTEHHGMVIGEAGEHAEWLGASQQQAGLRMDEFGQQIGHRAVQIVDQDALAPPANAPSMTALTSSVISRRARS